MERSHTCGVDSGIEHTEGLLIQNWTSPSGDNTISPSVEWRIS
jgi:hypothetical protein